eukprot:5574692-Alexandrium_andersonii.AAC.1
MPATRGPYKEWPREHFRWAGSDSMLRSWQTKLCESVRVQALRAASEAVMAVARECSKLSANARTWILG